MNTSKLDTIISTALLTFSLTIFCIVIYAKILNKYNTNKTVEITQEELLQFKEAKVTIHAFREMLLDIPDNIFNDVIIESYYWEQIEQYYKKYGDPYEL